MVAIPWPTALADGTASESYSFVHVLYQTVLYSQVTTARRQRLHRVLGERLEQGYGAQKGEVAAILAHHFIEGQEYRRAVPYLEQAARHALRRCAYREATSYLTKGLGLLEQLPETRERSRQELALQLALATPLMASKGYGAPDVEQAYTRAQALCEQLGDDTSPQLFQVLFGLRGVYMARAELQKAHDMAQQSLILAQPMQDQRLLLCAHYMLGATLFHRGDVEAHTHVQHVVEHLPSPALPMFFYGHDVGVVCLAYAAWAAWWCGYAQQARQRSHAALALAHELAHPFSLAFAHVQAAMVHQFHRELQAAREQSTAVIALTQEHGFALWHAVGSIVHGWCLAMQGESASGLPQIRQGLEALRTMGTRLMQPYLLALLAEACGAAQQPEAGLTAVAEGLTIANQTEEHWYDAELYRLRGELRLQQEPTSPKAETDMLHALTLASQRYTRSLELRAVLSLSRLWQSQGKRDAVRQLLEETSRWCTAGAETADLPEAAALRAALQ